MNILNIIVTICFIGSFFAYLVAVLGLFRLPDPYSKLHGLGVGDTFGFGLASIGFILLSPTNALRMKILVILILFWIVNPMMTHLLAKAGVLYGIDPTNKTKVREE
jgi:monovalent cation/proton antiporter MnhG/PhaG subunit